VVPVASSSANVYHEVVQPDTCTPTQMTGRVGRQSCIMCLTGFVQLGACTLPETVVSVLLHQAFTTSK
jgi:hypothetical protein